MADLRDTHTSGSWRRGLRHRRLRRRHSVGAVVALGVVLILLFVPGSAFAQPVGANQSWFYVGPAPGWTTAFGFTYNDTESPLKVLSFQVDAPTPGAYVFSSITLSVDGIVIPDVCSQPTAVSQPTIACTFASGAVSNGASVKLIFDSGSTIPKGNGGYVFFQDFAKKTKSNTVPGPLLAPGKPFVTDASLTGLKPRRPHFRFDGHQGANAPEIGSFNLNFLRGGLTINTNEPRTFTERWSHKKWSCTHKSKRELDCDTSTPVKTADVVIAYPLLRASSGLIKKSEENPKLKYKASLKINGKVIKTLEVPIQK